MSKSESQQREIASLIVDEAYYRSMYPDVASDSIDVVEHFALHGVGEGRLPSAESEGELRRLIEDNRSLRMRGYNLPVSALSSSHVLAEWPVRLDAGFLSQYYPRTMSSYDSPQHCVAHLYGSPSFFPAMSAAQHAARHYGLEEHLTADDLEAEFPPGVDPVVYYLTEGWRQTERVGDFEPVAYLHNYPDLAAALVNPLCHWLGSGRSEGRSVSKPELLGEGPAARGKVDTTVVFTHSLGRSGAPIVALDVARYLSQTSNVIIGTFADGPLLSEFTEVGDVYKVGSRAGDIRSFGLLALQRSCNRALVNSIASYRVPEALAALGIPVVSLVHDFPYAVGDSYRYEDYITASRATLVPASRLKKAYASTLGQFGMPGIADRLQQRAQGRIDRPTVRTQSAKMAGQPSSFREHLGIDRLGDERVVVNAASFEPRKGADLFIDVGAHLERAHQGVYALRWMGASLSDNDPAGYAKSLAAQLETHETEIDIEFVRAVPDYTPLWKYADCLALTSSLDPFPNVAIDALCAGVPVICFENASGIAELPSLNPTLDVTVVPFRDTKAFADAIHERLSNDSDAARKASAREARATFDSREYAAFVKRFFDADPSGNERFDIPWSTDLSVRRTGATGRVPINFQEAFDHQRRLLIDDLEAHVRDNATYLEAPRVTIRDIPVHEAPNASATDDADPLCFLVPRSQKGGEFVSHLARAGWRGYAIDRKTNNVFDIRYNGIFETEWDRFAGAERLRVISGANGGLPGRGSVPQVARTIADFNPQLPGAVRSSWATSVAEVFAARLEGRSFLITTLLEGEDLALFLEEYRDVPRLTEQLAKRPVVVERRWSATDLKAGSRRDQPYDAGSPAVSEQTAA